MPPLALNSWAWSKAFTSVLKSSFKMKVYNTIMGKCCCAFWCSNRYSKSVIPFYCFPTKPQKRHMWIAAVNLKDWAPSEYSWMCGAHFISGCKSNDPISPDYVPSVFSHIKSPIKRSLWRTWIGIKESLPVKGEGWRPLKECLLLNQCSNYLNMEMVMSFVNHTLASPLLHLCPCVVLKVWNMDTRMCWMKMDIINRVWVFKEDNQRLMKEEQHIKGAIQACPRRVQETEGDKGREWAETSRLSLSEEFFRDNDAKVKYYTGLPTFARWMALSNLLAPCVDCGKRSVLSCFQQLMAVLMKLLLRLGDQDIGFRFGLNQSTISRCFSKWINVMYIRMKPSIKWPDRYEVLKTMPMDFRKNFR